MKNKHDGKLILYLSLFSPLIDIITSIMLNNGVDFTLGIFVKCVMLFLMAIYLVFLDKKSWKKNLICILIIGIFNVLSIINNISILSDCAFSYFSFLIKFDFSLLSLYFFIRYFLEHKIDIKLLKIPIFILVGSILISNLTGTAFYTYDANRMGNSAWFSSGNEFGALLSILYPIAIYLFLDRKDSKKIDIIYVLILAFGMINLGTKVGLLSFYISSLAYLFFRIINAKNYKLNYSFYVMIFMVFIVSCLFNYLPTTVNVIKRYDYVVNNSEASEGEDPSINAASQVILSNRDQYLEYIMSNNYDLKDYLVGKFNYDGERIVVIEMDLFDVFYMFGIIGFILWYGLIGFIGIKVLIKYLKNMSTGLKYIKINMLIICIVLTFVISCLVGHVMLCPSVSLYFSIICAYLFAYDKFEKEENDKVKILIGAVHMKTGGIEKTLINLLHAIDYDRYEIDLFLQLENGPFYKEIPENVKIITPYPKFFSKFFASESKFSKLVKHLLYNKYTAWFWTSNKMYDVAIDYTGYYLFTNYYLIKTLSKKKLIWIHENVYGSLKYSSGFNRNFVKNINKYKYFDKIVCVSKSTKRDFDKMFPQYDDKTVVAYNIQDEIIKFREKVSLDGDFVIVSVGRICPQKGFDRLVLVHKKLIQDGYKVKTYIIGSGEDYQKLKNIIDDNDVANSFILLGQKSNVYDYLKAADLFVSSSYTEAFATVLFETMMCKLPWVGPKVSGVSDVFELSPNGSSLLTEDSIDGLYEGIKNVIDGNSKINRNFSFNIKQYNKKALKQFYKLIGEK